MNAMPEWTQGWTVRAGVGVAALLVAGAGVALVGGDPSADRSTMVGGDVGATGLATEAAVEESARTRVADAAAAGAGTAAPLPAAGAAADTVVPSGPAHVIKTATISVEIKEGAINSAVAAVSGVAATTGGFVEATARTASDAEDASADLTVRVPAPQFDAGLGKLRALGTVDAEELSGDDVTDQIVDYDARIRSLQAQEEALRALLAKAQGVGQILEVQNHVFDVRTQIEQLQAQREQLGRQAAMATIHVHLFEPGGAALAEETEPKEGLARSVELAADGAVAVIGGTIVVLGFGTPLAAIALVVWLVVRTVRRRTPAPVASA